MPSQKKKEDKQPLSKAFQMFTGAVYAFCGEPAVDGMETAKYVQTDIGAKLGKKK